MTDKLPSSSGSESPELVSHHLSLRDCVLDDNQLIAIDRNFDSITQVHENHIAQKITHIDLANNNLRDVSILRHYPRLEWLVLDNNPRLDLSTLFRSETVTMLSINKCNIRSLNEIIYNCRRFFPNLTWLSAMLNPCTTDENGEMNCYKTVSSSADGCYRHVLARGLPNIQYIDHISTVRLKDEINIMEQAREVEKRNAITRRQSMIQNQQLATITRTNTFNFKERFMALFCNIFLPTIDEADNIPEPPVRNRRHTNQLRRPRPQLDSIDESYDEDSGDTAIAGYSNSRTNGANGSNTNRRRNNESNGAIRKHTHHGGRQNEEANSSMRYRSTSCLTEMSNVTIESLQDVEPPNLRTVWGSLSERQKSTSEESFRSMEAAKNEKNAQYLREASTSHGLHTPRNDDGETLTDFVMSSVKQSSEHELDHV